MQARRIELLPSFDEAYDGLPQDVQLKTQEALAHFTDRTADNALRPELKNGFDNVWSIRITKGYRAFYKKVRDSEGAIYCMFHVGHHDDYRLLKRLSTRISITITPPKHVQEKQINPIPPGKQKKKNRH
jgi:mRNA-degrading endonuclease RelE of RelBE toxin-antitoxin system